MTALTVGVTAARNPACKRGLAVNLAASLARDPHRSLRVCVVDADPLNLDVTTRLAVRGPVLEDFADGVAPGASELGSVHEPQLWVLPSAGAGVGAAHRATERALRQLSDDFDVIVCDLDVIVCDLAAGSSGSARVVNGRLDHLDWVLLAVTPETEPVADAAHFLDQFQMSQDCGDVAEHVCVGVVTTGDEGSIRLSADVVAKAIGRPVLGSVPQLWGRSVPNLGFGAALGIAELDDAVASLFGRMNGVLDRPAGVPAI